MYINLFSADSHSNEFNIKVHSNTTFYISPLPPTPYLTSRLHAHSRHYTFRNLLKWRQLSSPHKPLFCNLLYIHDFDLIRISLIRFFFQIPYPLHSLLPVPVRMSLNQYKPCYQDVHTSDLHWNIVRASQCSQKMRRDLVYLFNQYCSPESLIQ